MNKQREEFEIWYASNNDFLINTQFEMEGDRYLDRYVRMAWLAWQKSSIPEGYVVVPREPTKAMLKTLSGYTLNPNLIYKAMIEAVEKNDE